MYVIRHLLAILILPTTMVVLVPRWLLGAPGDTRWIVGTAWAWISPLLGGIVFAGGFLLFAWCVLLFALVGRGTLAPWDPTRQLVVRGPYRHVRNPMISGVATMLAGEALFFGSRSLLVWFVGFVLVNHAFFVFVEEPGLRRRFGAMYDAYRRAVPRWIPRRTPWAGP